MPRQHLQDALSALREELETGAELDPQDRQALLDAAREIQDALAEVSGPSDEEGGVLSKRVSELIADFEASHPKFAEILGKVSEALANLGI
jgi:hypothetical protein